MCCARRAPLAVSDSSTVGRLRSAALTVLLVLAQVAMLVRAMVSAALLADASALPQAWQPVAGANSTVGARRLQAAGACNSMMAEMQPISQHCCGSNFEFCQGPVPSQCSAECQPVFESFYSRCQAMIVTDANHAEYVQFQSLCHPASQDASDILFQDDFEGGFGKWRGPSGATPATATLDSDPDGGHVLQIHDCIGGGVTPTLWTPSSAPRRLHASFRTG
eukprot:COSAG02_NODE_211_length_28730_cov_5.599490_28_plen_221_part_00